jgi:repressor LexA
MFSPLTKRQREIYEYIKKFLDANSYAPSLENIRDQFGLKAVSTVHEHLKRLHQKGYITKEINQARGVEIVTSNEFRKNCVEVQITGILSKGRLTHNPERQINIIFSCTDDVDHSGLFAVKIVDDFYKKDFFLKDDILIIRPVEKAQNKLYLTTTYSSNLHLLKKVKSEKTRFKLSSLNSEVTDRFYKRIRIIGEILQLVRNF